MPARDEDRKLLAWGVVAANAVLGALAAPMVLGRVYVQHDLGNYTLIARTFMRRSLERGDSMLWWPELDGGLYLHGLGQLGLYHPLRTLSYWAIPLPWSFHLELLLSYPLMLIGGYWLLRRWRLSASAALFGSMGFAFSGFNLLHFGHTNVVAVAAHIPWLLAMVDVLLRDTDPRRRVAASLGAAVLIASQMLLHFPQVAVMSFQVVGVYWLAVGFATGNLVRSLPLFLAALVLGCAMGAVQLVPSWDHLQYTPRIEASVAYRSMYSLAPDDLVQLVSPYLFAERFYQSPGAGGNTHELGSYAGAGCLALLVWLAARFRGLGERRRIVVGLLLVAWAGLDLSLGPHGLLYSIQVQIPLVGLFRAPARNILIVHLVLAGLAALAFDELSARQQRGERGSARGLWILTVPTLVAVAAAAVATAGFTRWNAQLAAPAWVWAGPLLAASAGVLVFAAARGRRWALPALMAFVAADQGFYGLSYAVEEPPVSYEEYRRRPAPLPPPDPRYRIHGGTTRFEEHTPNIFALWGYRLINSYSGASARTYLDYRNAKPLRIAGVSWIYRNDREERTVQYLSDPLPRARLVGRVVVTSDPMSALESIDVATTAVVEERLGLEPGVPGRAVLVEDRPGLISVETSAPSRQLLIVSERNLGGWVARVDGVPARVVRVYGDFLGCVVESGQHQVTFDLDPPSLRLGRNISLAALFAAISLYTILFARLRRRPAPVTPAGAGAPGAP